MSFNIFQASSLMQNQSRAEREKKKYKDILLIDDLIRQTSLFQ